MRDPSAPKLYILEHTDGAGHRMKSILEAIALSWRNKLNFGGLIGQLQPLTDQHINFRVVVDAIFGPDASRNFFIHNISSKPTFTEVPSARELEAKLSSFQPGTLVYCHAVNEWPLPQPCQAHCQHVANGPACRFQCFKCFAHAKGL